MNYSSFLIIYSEYFSFLVGINTLTNSGRGRRTGAVGQLFRQCGTGSEYIKASTSDLKPWRIVLA